ncbi:hypothetical protein V8G54_010184 [Vigna mungo]|uniref:Thaumatin-like protein 1 n=1 Tax=Vigna mungo TaxID=3915 RepID=A0AAQ3NYE0_VIGMU
MVNCATGLYSGTFTITNNCTYTVWPAVLSCTSLPLPTTGFTLLPGDSNILPMPPVWSGGLWGRTHSSIDITGKFSCVTGDCGTSTVECAGVNLTPAATLVEFDFNGTSQMNLYDISLVEGFSGESGSDEWKVFGAEFLLKVKEGFLLYVFMWCVSYFCCISLCCYE